MGLSFRSSWKTKWPWCTWSTLYFFFGNIIVLIYFTVETLYSTMYYSKYFIELNFDKSTKYVALWTHKRHPIPRPFGRAMECLLWVLQQKLTVLSRVSTVCHDDVMTWKHFTHYWPFVMGILGGFPSQRANDAGFDVFFVVTMKK